MSHETFCLMGHFWCGESEFYVYVESYDQVAKERSMRRRRFKRLWTGLHELRNRKNITRDDLLMHIGALKKIFYQYFVPNGTLQRINYTADRSDVID